MAITGEIHEGPYQRLGESPVMAAPAAAPKWLPQKSDSHEHVLDQILQASLTESTKVSTETPTSSPHQQYIFVATHFLRHSKDNGIAERH